jgi:hypothetical protein
MNSLSLPKSYTPFKSSASISEVGQDSSSKIQTPDSQWPNNFDHLSETFVRPSVQDDEPNNNLIVDHISTLQQINNKNQAALQVLNQQFGIVGIFFNLKIFFRWNNNLDGILKI